MTVTAGATGANSAPTAAGGRVPGPTILNRPPAGAPPARIPPAAACTVIVLGTLAVTALWWLNTPTITGLGEQLTNAGRLTGLWAGYAVLVLLALMARIPALERGAGSDRLARWHSMGGRYTVGLAVAHTLLIIWGYALIDHTSLTAQTSSVILTYPDVLMATVAVGLLLVVGVTSARAARRRLRYETWHFIHFYTYLAIALSFSHEFADGAEFVQNRPARVFWSALYVVVAVTVLWYRFLTPIVSAIRHDLRVAEVRWESPTVLSVYITGHDLTGLRAEAGQFFRWRFLTRDLWWAGNPYSLSAPPQRDYVRITVKATGEHSAALAELRPGTRVIAEGPSGGLTAARRKRRKVLMIAGGVGVTPLRALFETLPAGPGDIVMIYRANTPQELVLRHELEAIARRRAALLHCLVGPPRRGMHDHLSPQKLARLVPDVAERDVYLCGPEPMMTAARRSLHQLGVRRGHIHAESFVF